MRKMFFFICLFGTIGLYAQTDMTSKLANPDFEEQKTGWDTNGFGRQGNNTFELKNNDYYAEKWSGSTVGDTYIQQELKKLPAGTYTLTVVCQNILQSNTEQTCTGAWIYANDSRTDFNVPQEYTVVTTVTDGTLIVGAKTENCTGNYVCLDNFRLTYTFEYNATMRAYISNLLNTASDIDQNDNSDAHTELINARTNLQTLVDNSTVDGMETATRRLEQAIYDYQYASASTSNPLNLTSLIINPSFEDGITGWTTGGFGTTDNTAMSGKDGNVYCEKWNGGATGTGYVRQTVKDLPNGVYQLTARAMNVAESSPNSYPRKTGAYVFGETNQTLVTIQQDYTVEFTVINGEANIGFKLENSNADKSAVDNFRLSYRGRNATQETTAYNNLISSAQTLAGKPMNTDLRTALNAAINSASPDNVTTITILKEAMNAASDNNALYIELNTAITEAESELNRASNGDASLQALITHARSLYNSGDIDNDKLNTEKKALSDGIFIHKVANGTGTAPIVTTDATVIVGSSAMLGKMSTSGTVSQKGFCWATHSDPTISDNFSTYYQNNGETAYQDIFIMENVQHSTEYWVRAFAINNNYAIGYGEPVRVITLPESDTQYNFLWNGDDEHNEWLNNAMKEATAYYNTWTAIRGFRPTANYSPGTETADCSYGGWINVGPWRCNTGTMVHEMMHGTGVGQHGRWWDANLHGGDNGVDWLGERGNRVTNFFEPGYVCNGDGMHVCYEGNGNDMQQIRSVCLAQALYEDGLPAVSDGACPFYSFEYTNGTKYYITNGKFGRSKKYLCVKNGAVQYLPVNSINELKGDNNYAWYFNYEKNTGFYNIKNVGTGTYLNFNGDVVNTATSVTPVTVNTGGGVIYGGSQQLHLMPSRIYSEFTTATGNKIQVKPYWIAQSSRWENPYVINLASKNAENPTRDGLDFSNYAVTQFWYFLTADQLENVPTDTEETQSNILSGNGWQKIIDTMPENMGDYFYALYDNVETSTQLGLTLAYGSNNGNKTMVYSKSMNPAANKAAMWIMEPMKGFKKDDHLDYGNENFEDAETFLFSNVACPDSIIQGGDAAWNFRIEDNCDGWPDRGYVYPIPQSENVSDWIFYQNKGSYIGPWNNMKFEDGQEIAGNKSTGLCGYFSIYAISRGNFMKLNENLANADSNPIDVTYLIRNANGKFRNSFYNNYPIGWTCTQGSNVNTEGIFKVKRDWDFGIDNNDFDRDAFEAYCETWEGNLSNRSMSQTIGDLPNGYYAVTIVSDNTSAGAFLFANDQSKQFVKGSTRVITQVTDGNLTLGVKLESYKSNWIRFDDFTLTYMGTNEVIDIEEREHYAFHAADFNTADENRAASITVDNETNTFIVNGNEGDNNICFGLDAKNDDVNTKYYITPNESWYVVKGTGLSLDNAVMWYAFGEGRGNIPCKYSRTIDGQQVFAWDLSAWMSEAENTILAGSRYIDNIGLTSVQDDHKATITFVDYLTLDEVKQLFEIYSVKEELAKGGWTKLEGLEAGFDYSSKYFAIVDHTADLALTSTYQTGDNKAHWGGCYSMNYDDNKFANKDMAAVWTIDAFDADGNDLTSENIAGNFMLTNIQDPERHFRMEDWNASLWQSFTDRNPDYGSDRDRNRVFLIPSYSATDGWTFQSRQSSGYLGPWGQEWTSGAEFTANESEANKSTFDVYYMDRVAWMMQYRDWGLESEEAPVEITKLLTNPSLERFNEDKQPIGWTTTVNEGDEKSVLERGYMNGCDGQVYMNFYQNEGQLSNRGISQVVKGLPAGKYRLVVKRMAHGEGAYLYANNDSIEISHDGDNVEDFSLEFKLTSSSTDVKLGVALEDYTSNNCKVDNFRLYYLGTSSAFVGQGTITGKILPGATITVTYKDAFTESTDALSRGSGNVTINGTNTAIELTEEGFTLTLPAHLATNTEYTINIPANVIGYSTAQKFNAEQEYTFTTPKIFDGYYYLKNKLRNLYMGRGFSYGSGAYLTEYGSPIRIENHDDGTRIYFADNGLQFKDIWWMWTDGYDNRNFNVKVEGDYVRFANSNYYDANLCVGASTEDGNEFRLIGNCNGTEDAGLWSIETVSEHKAIIKAQDDAKSIAAANEGGYEGNTWTTIMQTLVTHTTTKVELEDANNFVESYQQSCSGNEDSSPYNIIDKTIEDQPAGLYRLSVNAFERATWFEDVADGDGFHGDAYIEVNGTKVNLMCLLEDGSATALNGNNKEKNGVYYADNIAAAQDAFEQGLYRNEVYIYLPETQDINYKVVIPSRYGNDGDRGRWICFQNFVLEHINDSLIPDIDNDGKVNLKDVIALKNILVTDHAISNYNYDVADVNLDGKISISDLAALINYIKE